MIKEDLNKSLNAEQYQASVTEFGNILVLAGAGTGKTSTIAARVIFLLREQKIKPEDIILLTFTDKASIEMKERLKRYIYDKVVDKMSISTFHALCLGIVKKHYPSKKLIDENDTKRLFETTYSRVIKFKPDGFYAPSTLLKHIDNYINSNTKDIFSEWLTSFLAFEEDNKNYLLEQYQLVYDSYEEDKKKYNLLSFSDLLVTAKEYISSHENSIKEMIVDEFQDTNPLQNSTINAVNPNSLFCVGDYDQSIYAFNGADLSIIENFKDRSDFKLHNLSKNYRCRKPILDIAERVIANNPRIYPKSLEVMVQADDAIEPYCITTDSPLEQYVRISDLCKEKLATKHKHESIAVLYRSNGSGDAIELSLKEKNIEVVRKVKNKFMENLEIQLVFNVLKLIIYRNLDFLAFINLFVGIVDNNSKEAIESYYNMISVNQTIPLIDGLRKDKARNIGAHGVFHSNSKESVLSLLDILEFKKSVKPESLINTILHSKYFINSINKWAEQVGGGEDDKADKIFNNSIRRVESILKIAKRYKSTVKFYDDMTRTSKSEEDSSKIGDDVVYLLTVHSSKGLEYDYVFVIDMDDNTFPNKKLMDKKSDAEERRLFYVAATRAKKELVFSFSKKSAYDAKKKPSRFLIEAGLVEAKK